MIFNKWAWKRVLLGGLGFVSSACLVSCAQHRHSLWVDPGIETSLQTDVNSGEIPIGGDAHDLDFQRGLSSDNDSDLVGIDSDNNGIRDDVEEAIHFRYQQDQLQQDSLLQTAWAYQGVLATTHDKNLSNAYIRAFLRSLECGAVVFGKELPEVQAELESIVINTWPRVEALVRAESLFSGQVYQLLPSNRSYEACELTSGDNDFSRSLPLTNSVPRDGIGTSIYYTNGIRTSLSAAMIEINSLRAAIQDPSTPGGKVDQRIESDLNQLNYILSYNTTEGTVNDVCQTLSQKLREISRDPTLCFRLFFSLGRFERERPLANYSRKLLAWVYSIQLAQANLQQSIDLQTQFDHYQESLNSGQRLIVIGYSQGNLLINQTYESLSRLNLTDSVGVISIANVTNNVPGGDLIRNNRWVTFQDDWVVNALRILFPKTLPGNISSRDNDCSIDLVPDINHYLAEDYLCEPNDGTGLVARYKILELIANLGENLPYPSP
jgi:hypothetical protein